MQEINLSASKEQNLMLSKSDAQWGFGSGQQSMAKRFLSFYCLPSMQGRRISSSTIRTPYFCKLFHYLFITFVFLFFLFWSKCQIHSCLAGVIIYGSKSSSEFFTPQNDEWIIIWHFWRVFDTLFLYYLHITLLFSCLALGRFSAIPKKDQYIFVLSFLDNTGIVKSDSDQSTVQTGELFHIKSQDQRQTILRIICSFTFKQMHQLF